MDEEERDLYIKLEKFTFGISLDVLYHYFEMKILGKEKFFCFLNRCQHKLFHALYPMTSCCKCINEFIPLSTITLGIYQFKLLFNSEISRCLYNNGAQYCQCKYSALRSVQVNDLDISLVYAIIKICCPSIPGNPQLIKDIKDTRNVLAHKNLRLKKDEYDTWLNIVEKATLDLAKVVSFTFCKMIKNQISDFKKDVPSSNTNVESMLNKLELNVTQKSKSIGRDIIDNMKNWKDELSIIINKLVFEVKKPCICEQFTSQKIAEEQDEVDIRIKEILRKKFISDTSNNIPVILVKEKVEKELRRIGKHYNVHKDPLKRLVMECFPGVTCKKSKKKKQLWLQNLRMAPDTDDEDESDDGKVEGDIESGETGYATSTSQTAQPQRTQSKNEKTIWKNKCRVVWKLETPDTWNVSKIKDTLQHVSHLLKEWFEIEFVFIGSLVIRTIVPEYILSNYDDFKSAVRSFLAKIVEVCQLDTDTPTVVKVDLNIFTEIPPSDSVTCYVCGKWCGTERVHRIHHLRVHTDIWESTFKGEMEERFQKEHMKMRLDYNPSTFISSTEPVKFSQDDSMIDKEIGKIEHFSPIRLEDDITVPKSADI